MIGRLKILKRLVQGCPKCGSSLILLGSLRGLDHRLNNNKFIIIKSMVWISVTRGILKCSSLSYYQITGTIRP